MTDEDLRQTVKGVRFVLHKNPWNLLHAERARLAHVQRDNRPLYRAYLLKETLLDILDRSQPHVAERKLDEWLRWALRSRLKPFKKLARTIRKYKQGILAYVRTGLSNGRTEGLNGKARTITRRSFGLHSAKSLIAMLFLCCSGLVLTPTHRVPILRNEHPLVL